MRFLSLVLILVGFSGFSQQKFEREYRIKPDQVPAKAKEFVAKCNFDKKIKWYAEESQDGKTIEAKSCKNKHKFSVEFDVNGNILDVEKTIKWKEIPAKKQQVIKKALSSRFKKYKIRKIQIQWQTDHDFYIDLINEKGENDIKELYEIVVKGRKNKEYKRYELLIDAQGTILKELQFAPQNTDNLEF